jgi:hypothetical protein
VGRSLSRSPRPPRPCARIAVLCFGSARHERLISVSLPTFGVARVAPTRPKRGNASTRDVRRVPVLHVATSPHSGSRRPSAPRAMPAAVSGEVFYRRVFRCTR